MNKKRTRQWRKFPRPRTKGLEGVVACTTEISTIFDTTLLYRGYTIEDLAAHCGFEEVVYLLWNGELPTKDQLDAFKQKLDQNLTLPAGLAARTRRHREDQLPSRWPSSARRFRASASLDLEGRGHLARRRPGQGHAPRPARSARSWPRSRASSRDRSPSRRIPGKTHRVELPQYDPRQGAERRRRKALRHRARSPRRPRVQRLDVHRARGGFDDQRLLQRHGRRALLAQGPAPRRRQRSRHADAQGDRHATTRWTRSSTTPSTRRRRSWASAIAFTRTATRAPASCKEMSLGTCKRAGLEDYHRMLMRIEEQMEEKKGLMPNVDFYSGLVYTALGPALARLHADLRGQPRLRLERAGARAVRQQPHLPPARLLDRQDGPQDRPLGSF